MKNDWKFRVERYGNDLIIPMGRATCFGGSDDPQDSGETASGVSTRANPDLCACALPMRYTGTNRHLLEALGGSPIPKMPWFTKVEFAAAQASHGVANIIVPVIDLGPAKRTGNAIDLTIAAARKIDPKATARSFTAWGCIRIIGGAKYL